MKARKGPAGREESLVARAEERANRPGEGHAGRRQQAWAALCLAAGLLLLGLAVWAAGALQWAYFGPKKTQITGLDPYKSNKKNTINK